MSELEQCMPFQLRAAKISGWVPEVEWHPSRRFRSDFCWPDRKLLVEVEGGQFVQGRHQRSSGFEADCVKYNEAVVMGFAVLRFSTRMVTSGEALRMVERFLEGRAR